MNARRHHREAGFTLVEMLVVLVLTSLLTGILATALHQVMRLQQHFGTETFNSQQGAMQAAWFRDCINGAMPGERKGKDAFRGTSEELHGLTLAPLNLPPGTLAPFVWRLQFNVRLGRMELRYGTDDAAPAIMSWPGNSGRFSFIDAQGEAHDAWPPFTGQWPQLPAAIRLETGAGAEEMSLIAVPKGPIEQPQRLRNLEG